MFQQVGSHHRGQRVLGTIGMIHLPIDLDEATTPSAAEQAKPLPFSVNHPSEKIARNILERLVPPTRPLLRNLESAKRVQGEEFGKTDDNLRHETAAQLRLAATSIMAKVPSRLLPDAGKSRVEGRVDAEVKRDGSSYRRPNARAAHC